MCTRQNLEWFRAIRSATFVDEILIPGESDAIRIQIEVQWMGRFTEVRTIETSSVNEEDDGAGCKIEVDHYLISSHDSGVQLSADIFYRSDETIAFWNEVYFSTALPEGMTARGLGRLVE